MSQPRAASCSRRYKLVLLCAPESRRDPSLIDEDKTRRIELGLLGVEGSALGSNVRAILLGSA